MTEFIFNSNRSMIIFEKSQINYYLLNLDGAKELIKSFSTEGLVNVELIYPKQFWLLNVFLIIVSLFDFSAITSEYKLKIKLQNKEHFLSLGVLSKRKRKEIILVLESTTLWS